MIRDHVISHIRLQEAYDNYDQVYKATASKKRSAVTDGRYTLTIWIFP